MPALTSVSQGLAILPARLLVFSRSTEMAIGIVHVMILAFVL